MDIFELTILYGPVLFGLATAVLLHQMIVVVCRDVPMEAQEWEFETRRQMRMRERAVCYRWFEPFVIEIRDLCRTPTGIKWLDALGVRKSIIEALDRLGTSVPFQWDEFIALSIFEGILASLGCLVWLRSSISVGFLCLLAPAVGILVFSTRTSSLKSRAKRRLAEFKKRLPFSVDLMALMMDAGATFLESVVTMVAENKDNPIGEEFGDLHRKVISGRTLTDGLEDMQGRMRDPTVDEIVFSIVNSEKLGTPKSVTLLRLAEQMRMKRTQDVEKAIGQAQTMMTFPGFIIMLACLLVVLGPFGLRAMQEW